MGDADECMRHILSSGLSADERRRKSVLTGVSKTEYDCDTIRKLRGVNPSYQQGRYDCNQLISDMIAIMIADTT